MAFGLMRLLLADPGPLGRPDTLTLALSHEGRGDVLLCREVTAVNFGHPPARCARVPLRGAKGGSNGVHCFSLDSRVRGNDGAVRGNDWKSDGLVSIYPIENDGGRINA